MTAIAPTGFLLLLDAVDRANRYWASPTEPEAILSDLQIFAGGTWVDADYDERLDVHGWQRFRTELLVTGLLPAYVQMEADRTVWRLPADVWRSAKSNEARISGMYETEPVIVRANDIDIAVSGKSAPPGSEPMLRDATPDSSGILQNQGKGKGGRPPDYEKMRAFLTAACHLIYNDKPHFKGENEFRNAVLHRLSELGLEAPSDPITRQISKKLWATLHVEIR